MTRSTRLSVVLLALMLAVPAFAGHDALSLVPNDAVSVGVVRLAELRTSPLSSTFFEHADRVGGSGDSDKFLRDAGLEPSKDIDLVMVATSPRTALGNEADILVVAEGRFNAQRLTAALIERGAVKKDGYLLTPEHDRGDASDRGAVAFPATGLVIAGTEQAVIEALAARKAGGTTFTNASALGHDLARIDPDASAFAIVDIVRAQRLTNGPKGPKRDHGFATALKNLNTVGVWATDTGDAVRLGAFGMGSDAETLQLVEDTVRGALATMRLAVQEKAPEMVSVLRKFSVTRTDDSVTLRGSIDGDVLRNVVAKGKAKKRSHDHDNER